MYFWKKHIMQTSHRFSRKKNKCIRGHISVHTACRHCSDVSSQVSGDCLGDMTTVVIVSWLDRRDSLAWRHSRTNGTSPYSACRSAAAQ